MTLEINTPLSKMFFIVPESIQTFFLLPILPNVVPKSILLMTNAISQIPIMDSLALHNYTMDYIGCLALWKEQKMCTSLSTLVQTWEAMLKQLWSHELQLHLLLLMYGMHALDTSQW